MNSTVGPFILIRRIVDPARFVERWAPFYSYDDEHLYDDNISKPLTKRRVLALYKWKNGRRLSEVKERSVLRNYVDRIPEVEQLHPRTSADAFLECFEGGPIWRIYWLHLWAPTRFPIYDQHVHRAMAWIETGQPEEIPASGWATIEAYLNRYLSFFASFRSLDRRHVDKALWSCGRHMKKGQRCTDRLTGCGHARCSSCPRGGPSTRIVRMRIGDWNPASCR